MKILFVMNGKSYGGTEQQLFNLVYSLRGKNVTCTVLIENSLLARKLRELNIETYCEDFDDRATIIEKTRKLSIKNHLVHAHRWDALQLASSALQQTKNTPLICTIHSVFEPAIWTEEKRLLMNSKMKALIWETACTITVSNAIKDSLVHNGHNEECIEVIYNGVIPYEREVAPNVDLLTFGYLGRLHYEKGPDLFVEALRLLMEENPLLPFKAYIIG